MSMIWEPEGRQRPTIESGVRLTGTSCATAEKPHQDSPNPRQLIDAVDALFVDAQIPPFSAASMLQNVHIWIKGRGMGSHMPRCGALSNGRQMVQLRNSSRNPVASPAEQIRRQFQTYISVFLTNTRTQLSSADGTATAIGDEILWDRHNTPNFMRSAFWHYWRMCKVTQPPMGSDKFMPRVPAVQSVRKLPSWPGAVGVRCEQYHGITRVAHGCGTTKRDMVPCS
ncbi:hypothetical protein GLOTRDRAFT_94381 [Gloeophyllum trabeum ATCC 11539]|uniref:Uncharacterized protein n=1 Tax=Gloeophyllum trabeum (strain ATCC 11539 / FP-39264 / Madison 617) TaxID=670483 RepID=S7RMR5_GLOTA|nr:uncharacterized protein GLOTRDRAFT_94381 [Gloeophyllum trabeum ATCC 11539]EPQ53974.1 hypothetical protein GLOTRDRAFT_94381 [Gloeophyllum trabeum ATCC 11539]